MSKYLGKIEENSCYGKIGVRITKGVHVGSVFLFSYLNYATNELNTSYGILSQHPTTGSHIIIDCVYHNYERDLASIVLIDEIIHWNLVSNAMILEMTAYDYFMYEKA